MIPDRLVVAKAVLTGDLGQVLALLDDVIG